MGFRALLILVCVAWGAPSAIGADAAREFSQQFELRLAENAPGDGLTEATIGEEGETIYLAPTVIVTGRDLVRAGLSKDDVGSLRVDLEFTEAAGKKLAKATAANLGKRMAIVCGGKVISAPTVQSSISTEVAISGNFTKADLVALLTELIEE